MTQSKGETLVYKEVRKNIWTGPRIVLSVIIILISLTCLLPFINVLALSLSSKSAILRGDVAFLPVEINFTAYKAIFADKSMVRSLFFTVGITVVYTALSMLMTVLMAYPLTKKRLRGRKFFNFLALFTMYFSGGTIPIYLNIKALGLLDTPWALILPGMLSTYNMIILKSFFTALPKELEETAFIDGANDFQVLLQIYLPLSMASLATLTLFYAVGKWNSFQDALYYITNKAYQPLQLKLYHIQGLPGGGRGRDGGRLQHRGVEHLRVHRAGVHHIRHAADPGGVPLRSALLRQGRHHRRDQGVSAIN